MASKQRRSAADNKVEHGNKDESTAVRGHVLGIVRGRSKRWLTWLKQ